MGKEHDKTPGSLSTDIQNKINREYDDEKASRLDIVRDTLSDVNGVIQSPPIFITLNVLLLLIVFFVGRVMIVFVDPIPKPDPLDPGIKSSLLSSAERKYDKYYLAKLGEGNFVFRDRIHDHNESTIHEVISIDINSPIGYSDYRSASHIDINMPSKKTHTMSISDRHLIGGDVKLINKSGCSGSRCYLKLIIQSSDKKYLHGNYIIHVKNNMGEEIHKKSSYISRSDLSINDTPPDLEYERHTSDEGKDSIVITKASSHPFTRFEVYSQLPGGEIVQNDIFTSSDTSNIELKLPEGHTGLMIYGSGFNPPYFDNKVRDYNIYDDFPNPVQDR